MARLQSCCLLRSLASFALDLINISNGPGEFEKRRSIPDNEDWTNFFER